MQAPVSPTPGSCGLSDHPCRKAIEGGGQLADILAGMPEIVEALDENGRNKGRDTTVTQFLYRGRRPQVPRQASCIA
jgi:hypothetical protein